MICQNCKANIASVHFTQLIDHCKIEMHLCEKCALEMGKFSIISPMSINDFFSGILQFTPEPTCQDVETKALVCEQCGMSDEELLKTGKLGCSHCYQLYREKLNPLLTRLHGNINHCGKMPTKVSKNIQMSRQIDGLKQDLNEAIKNEEYEEAAKIRDQIKELELCR